VLLLCAGCGSTSSGDFLAQASTICREAQKRGSGLKSPRSPSEVVPFFDRVLPLVQNEVERLHALRPSGERASAFRTYLGGLDQAVGLIQRADAAAKAGDLQEVQAIIREGDSLTQTNVANAKAASLGTCANAS
jgi:hypothetical protein